MMEYRTKYLEAGLDGLNSTGIPFVEKLNGSLVSIIPGDDQGIYLFVPYLAKMFHLSIPTANLYFFLLALALATLISGAWLVFSKIPAYLKVSIALLSIFIGLGAIPVVDDVYLLSSFAVIAIFPLALLPVKGGLSMLAYPIFLATGIYISFAGFTRGDAGWMGLCLFLLFALRWIIEGNSLNRRLAPLGFATLAFLSGYFLFFLFQKDLKATAHAYVATQQTATLQNKENFDEFHPLWHNIYLGLGYYKNPFGITYEDAFAMKTVKQLMPQTPPMSKEYNDVLKVEFFKLVRLEPFYFVKTIFKKLFKSIDMALTGKLFRSLYLIAPLFLLNIFYLFRAWRLYKQRHCPTALIYMGIALCVTLLPALLTAPKREYLMAFLTLWPLTGLAFLAPESPNVQSNEL